MTDKTFASIAMAAGAGALATLTGMYISKKIRQKTTKKNRMKLHNNHLFLSTRCTWLIAELGAEEDFELISEDGLPPYPEDVELPSELLMIQHSDINTNLQTQLQLARQCGGPSGDSDVDLGILDGGMSPYGMSSAGMPAMIINDDFTMIEGAAICMYLADTYERFLPLAQYKAEYYSWIVCSAATFDNIIKTLQQQMVDTPPSERDECVLHSATKAFHAFARALCSSLEQRDYLCGKHFTAADCVVGFTLHWAHTIDDGILLEDYPILQRYLSRLKQRPSFQKTFGTDNSWSWSQYFKTSIRAIKDS